MYNREIKERFIKEQFTDVSMRIASSKTFEATEKYESAWGADLCTRSTEELQQLTDNIIGIRSGGQHLRIRILKRYVQWCLDNNIDGACDGMLYVQASSVNKMKLRTVTSPLHLQVFLNSVFRPESDQTLDNVFRCFLWLAYGGVREEDVMSIRCGDVSLENMTVVLGGREYPIYREAIAAFKNCVTLKQFRYIHPLYSKQIYKDRFPSDLLLRGTKTEYTMDLMRTKVSVKNTEAIRSGATNLKLSYYRVWLSGLFYRMYEREIAGFPVSFKQAAIEFMNGREYNFKDERGKKLYLSSVARDYFVDYEAWKMTF